MSNKEVRQLLSCKPYFSYPYLSKGSHWNNKSIHRRSLRWIGKNLRHRNKLYEFGLWYDYPICCIEQFVQRNRPIDEEQHKCIKLMRENNEFSRVPCISCMQNYMSTHDSRT